MKKNFFDGLGDALSRTTKDLSKKAGQIYETQKIQTKIAGEEHMVEKLKEEIGSLIYERYQAGEELDEKLKAFCEEIDGHRNVIDGYKSAAADLKGCKICPSCKKPVDREVAFCPYCGAPCPSPEPERTEGEVVDAEGNPCDCGSFEPSEGAEEAENLQAAEEPVVEQEIPQPVEEEHTEEAQ